MRFTKLLLNSTTLTLTNWLVFMLAFVWTCFIHESVLWWQKLHWYSWLTELGSIVLLRGIPAGSVWILWLLLSAALSVMWMLARILKLRQRSQPAPVAVHEPEEIDEASQADPLVAQVELAESQPELREKILRLHASLDKI